MKNPMTPIGNRTRHLLPCNPVTQPTPPPCNPVRHLVAKKFTGTKTNLPFAEPSNFSWQPYKRATKYNFRRNVLTMSGSLYLSPFRGGYGICCWIIRIPNTSSALKTKEERRLINERIPYSQKTTLIFHPLNLCVIVASFRGFVRVPDVIQCESKHVAIWRDILFWNGIMFDIRFLFVFNEHYTKKGWLRTRLLFSVFNWLSLISRLNYLYVHGVKNMWK